MTFNVETNDTPFGELSDEDAAALFIAWRHGRRIIRYDSCHTPCKMWSPQVVHRAEPLPLIPASFDFAGLDPKWRWCVADQGGSVWIYTGKPVMWSDAWRPSPGDAIRRIDGLFPSYIRGTVPWQETPIERR